MKLRYYMRGLGIGILVTALLLILSGRESNSLSDQQIMERAAELGMVMDDKSVLKETETEAQQEEMAPKPVKEEQSKVEKVEETEQKEVKQEEPAQEETEQKEVKQEEPIREENQPEEPEQENPLTEETGAEEMVTITVPSGASSVSVAKLIEQAGLVDSATEFDSYLCRNGYDKKICVGSHAIPKNATEEKIAKAITGK